jgi:hypothetical protein
MRERTWTFHQGTLWDWIHDYLYWANDQGAYIDDLLDDTAWFSDYLDHLDAEVRQSENAITGPVCAWCDRDLASDPVRYLAPLAGHNRLCCRWCAIEVSGAELWEAPEEDADEIPF